jgi:NAD(P)-dependent dehydrogenase (short-subunit alcohol dehydrogenase family)
MQFGCNLLGQFLWTARLLPLLLASAPSRIVNLSSQSHLLSGVDLDDPNYERREYQKWEAYGQAKSANILFTQELERRFGGRGVHAYAVHPGTIATELGRHMVEEDFTFISSRQAERPAGGPKTAFKSVEEGAATQVYAATGDDIPGAAYLADGAVAPYVADHATDGDVAARLWTLSEELVGEAFPG